MTVDKIRVRASVCIPTYNSAQYLGAAIESVLTQEFADFELVVSDNASSDGTQELCGKYDDRRLRYVRFDEFVSQSGNWNRCIDLAEGEFIVILHADDVLLPGYLRRAVEIIHRNPDVGLVHCSVRHIDRDGKELHLQRLFDSDRVDREGEILRKLLIDGCVVNPSGVMVPRKVYESIGKFTDEIVWGVDWHMWIRIALDWPVAYIAEPLAQYRQHPQSGTSSVMSTARNGTDELWMIKDVFQRMENSHSELNALRPQAIRRVAHRTWCFAEEMCQLGFGRATRAGIRRAVAISPAMIVDPKVAALWMASWLGYDRFAQLHAWKQR